MPGLRVDLCRLGAAGFSILELLVTFSIAAGLSGIAIYNMHALRQPAAEAAANTVGFVKRTRAKALATTHAYTIRPLTEDLLITTYAKNCHAAKQDLDDSLTLTLPEGAEFATTEWSICFSSRGVSEGSVNVNIKDDDQTKKIQIAAGGGARVS